LPLKRPAKTRSGRALKGARSFVTIGFCRTRAPTIYRSFGKFKICPLSENLTCDGNNIDRPFDESPMKSHELPLSGFAGPFFWTKGDKRSRIPEFLYFGGLPGAPCE
jgi:hypothetical protein